MQAAQVIDGPWPKNVSEDQIILAAIHTAELCAIEGERLDGELTKTHARLVDATLIVAPWFAKHRFKDDGTPISTQAWSHFLIDKQITIPIDQVGLLIRLGQDLDGAKKFLAAPELQNICSWSTLITTKYRALLRKYLRNPRAYTSSPKEKREVPQSKTPIAHLENYKKVYAIYERSHTIKAIAKAVQIKGNGDLWNLILEGIELGFIPKNPIDIVAHQRHPNLRLLFPTALSSQQFFRNYNLNRPQDTTYIRNTLWPIAKAHREAVLKNPLVLEKLVTEHEQAVTKKKHEILRMDFAKAETAKAIAALPTDQPPIKMYGKDIWPSPFYEWDDVREGCLLFIALLRLLQDSPHHTTPHAKARMVRMTGRMLPRYCAKLWQVCLAIAAAYEADPQGECKPAEEPKNGAWVRR